MYRFPSGLEISKFTTARVICSREVVNVALYIEHYDTSTENAAVADVLRETYAPHLGTYGLSVDNWHGSKETIKRERVLTTIESGYETGSAKDVAERAAQVLTGWARMVVDHPATSIDSKVRERT